MRTQILSKWSSQGPRIGSYGVGIIGHRGGKFADLKWSTIFLPITLRDHSGFFLGHILATMGQKSFSSLLKYATLSYCHCSLGCQAKSRLKTLYWLDQGSCNCRKTVCHTVESQKHILILLLYLCLCLNH